MTERRTALGVFVCSLMLAACAASPTPRQSASPRDAVPAQRPPGSAAAHQNLFANMVAVVAAMGGNNPNLAYRAFTTKSCVRHGLLFTGPQPLERPSGSLQPALPARCQHLADNRATRISPAAMPLR